MASVLCHCVYTTPWYEVGCSLQCWQYLPCSRLGLGAVLRFLERSEGLGHFNRSKIEATSLPLLLLLPAVSLSGSALLKLEDGVDILDTWITWTRGLVLKPEQLTAVQSLLKGVNVFVSVSTGFGKSLVYQLLPFCAIHLLQSSPWSSRHLWW